uniref:Uncharacterized protein n=1 Tax=Cacopsylla melanoneura TaxID=428564 RepID=A0A8D8YS47_9HEMI
MRTRYSPVISTTMVTPLFRRPKTDRAAYGARQIWIERNDMFYGIRYVPKYTYFYFFVANNVLSTFIDYNLQSRYLNTMSFKNKYSIPIGTKGCFFYKQKNGVLIIL